MKGWKKWKRERTGSHSGRVKTYLAIRLIVGENNSALCEHCYKNLLFPNFHDHFTELLD